MEMEKQLEELKNLWTPENIKRLMNVDREIDIKIGDELDIREFAKLAGEYIKNATIIKNKFTVFISQDIVKKRIKLDFAPFEEK